MTPARLAAYHVFRAKEVREVARRHPGRSSSPRAEAVARSHLERALTVIRYCAGGRVREDARQLLKVVESLK